MIKYNNSNINDWNFGEDNIIKVYRNNAVCYYKVTSGDTPTPVQEPCFAVVDNISQYSETEFDDVFNLADEKWYKLNNLNQYEEYGVYGSGRTITTYDGKLTIDTETQPSILPQGYTEVEYIENTSTAYINTNYNPNQDTRIVADMQVVSYNTYGRLFGAGNHNTANTISCDYVENGVLFEVSWGGITGWSQYASEVNYNRRSYDWNKNSFYIDGTLLDTKTFKSFTCSYKLGIFNVLESGDVPTSNTGRYFYGKLYSFKIYDNDTLVRDFVPCKRDSDSKYGLYDVVNDVFYISPNNVDFSGGEPIAPTKTYEYMYSGGSWVNLGEVSGSTITIKSPEYIEKDSSHNGKINLDYVWNTNTKLQFKFYSTNNGGGAMIGEDGTPDNNDCRVFFASTTAYFDYGSGRIIWPSKGQKNTLYEYEYGNYYIKNMNTSASMSDTAFSTNRTNPVYLGLGGTDYFRTYYIKFYDGDTLVKDFIPWTDTNGNFGLYEKVSNTIYSATSGSFTASTVWNDVEVGGGGIEYPLEYVVREDPPDNLIFTSMEEAEEYECPWVGMKAKIDGDNYVFSGDSQSGYEWVYNPSRLPDGYTEVEYVTSENIPTGASGAYIDTNYIPNQTTRVVMDYQPMVNGQTHRRIFGSGEFNSTGYVWNMEGTLGETSCYYYYKFGAGRSWYTTSINPDLNRHILDFNNNGQILLDGASVATLPSNTFTCTFNLGIFRSIFNQYQQYNICFLGRVYSTKVYDNGTLVRDLVPCTRDSDSMVGMYDLINDVFYYPPNYTSYQLVAGPIV